MESSYPAQAGEQLVALSNALKQTRRLDAVAWVLWSQGYPVTKRIREQLVEKYRRLGQHLLDEWDKFDREDPDPNNAIERYAVSRLPPGSGLGELRRQVGKAGLPTLLSALMKVELGTFESETYRAEDVGRVFARGFEGKGSADVVGCVKDTLTLMSTEVSVPATLRAIEECAEEDLERFRDEVRQFLRTLAIRAPPNVFEWLFCMWFLWRRVSPTCRQFIEETLSARARFFHWGVSPTFQQFIEDMLSARDHRSRTEFRFLLRGRFP